MPLDALCLSGLVHELNGALSRGQNRQNLSAGPG